jgi:hypothetical protein
VAAAAVAAVAAAAAAGCGVERFAGRTSVCLSACMATYRLRADREREMNQLLLTVRRTNSFLLPLSFHECLSTATA